MPEIFLEFIGNASPWLVPLLVVLAVWGKFNWDTLNNPAKKASFDRAVGWLREDSFGKLYLRFLGGLMDRVGDWIGDRSRLSQEAMVEAQSKGLVQRVFGFNPFTAESYEKCLWLAFIYPVFAYLIAWAMGAEGWVGNTNFFRDESNKLMLWQRLSILGGVLSFVGIGLWLAFYWKGWKQWLILTGTLLLEATIGIWFGVAETITELFGIFFLSFLLILIPLYLGGWLTLLVFYRAVKTAHREIYKLALAVASTATFAFAFAFVFSSVFIDVDVDTLAGAYTIAYYFTGVLAGFVVVALADAITGAVAGIVVLAGAAVPTVSIDFFSGDDVDVFIVFFAVGIFASAGIIIMILRTLQRWGSAVGCMHWLWFIYTGLIVSLGFAFLSALDEYDSREMLLVLLWWLLPLVNAPLDWLSLGFTRGLLQAVRTGNHSGWRTLIWAVADLLLAFFFLFLITAALVGVTALGNAIAGKTLVDLGCILNNLKTDMSHPDHWWIYFMLLSTLVPTLFHFALAGGAASLWLPRKWRIQLADGLEEDMHKTFGAWVYLTFTPVVGFILMPFALLGSLWWLLNVNGGMFGGWLLGWAISLAEWADPSMALVCTTG